MYKKSIFRLIGIFALLCAWLPASLTAAESFKVSLNSGWQMVSVPFTPTEGADKSGDAKINAILGESSTTVNSIWGWSGTTWEIYPTSLLNLYNNANPDAQAVALTELKAGEGYWIKSKKGGSFTITGQRPADPEKLSLSTDGNKFHLVGFSFKGIEEASSLTEGDDKLLSLGDGEAARLWGWSGASWCIKTTEEGGIAKFNQTYGTFFNSCDKLYEGRAYWLQVLGSSGSKDLALDFPPSPAMPETSAYGNAEVTIGTGTKTVSFYETDLVTPIIDVAIIYDGDAETLTFQKEGYNTRVLTGVSSVDHVKSAYNLIKKDGGVNDLAPNNSSHSTNAPGNIILQDSKRTARIVFDGVMGDTGALVQITPMTTLAGVMGSDPETGQNELAALGKMVAGFTVFLGNHEGTGELENGYLDLEDEKYNAKLIPSISSKAFMKTSGGDNVMMNALDLYKNIMDPDENWSKDENTGELTEVASNGKIPPAGKLFLYTFDPNRENKKWEKVENCEVRLVGRTSSGVKKLTEIQTEIGLQNKVNIGPKFVKPTDDPEFLRLKGKYALAPEKTDECSIKHMYPAFAFIFESTGAPTRKIRVQVVDEESGDGIPNTQVRVDGTLEFTTDTDGYLKRIDKGLSPKGVFTYAPTLGTKKIVIVAIGEEHYANSVEVVSGSLKQGSDFEHTPNEVDDNNESYVGALKGTSNDVVIRLKKRADTGTIVGMVKVEDPFFGEQPFPGVTVSLRHPTSLNAEEVSVNTDEDGEFDTIDIGADNSAKFLWTFYPIKGAAKITPETTTARTSSKTTPKIINFRGGDPRLERISTVIDPVTGETAKVTLPDGVTQEELVPIFIGEGECESGHHASCSVWEDDRVLKGTEKTGVEDKTLDNSGKIMGADGGHSITRKQVLNAIIRENYLAGEYGVQVRVEHCIPLILSDEEIAQKIKEEDICYRTKDEVGFAYTGKKFVETLNGGAIRIEVKEDAIDSSSTLAVGGGDSEVRGGAKLNFYKATGEFWNDLRLKWYATILFKDSTEEDVFPGTDTKRGELGYDYTTKDEHNPDPGECNPGEINYYLNFNAKDGESDVAEIWKPGLPYTKVNPEYLGYTAGEWEAVIEDQGLEFYCEINIQPGQDDEVVDFGGVTRDSTWIQHDLQRRMVEKYGILLQDSALEGGTYMLSTEVVNNLLVEKFAHLALPIDERFENGRTYLKEDGPIDDIPGSLSFLQDYMSVIVTVVIEGYSGDFEDDVMTAQTQYSLSLGEGKIADGVEISAAGFDPTSELPTFISTVTDKTMAPLSDIPSDEVLTPEGADEIANAALEADVTLNYQFNGIPFELSDALRITVQPGKYHRIKQFDDNGMPMLDMRFDQPRLGGNGDGEIKVDDGEKAYHITDYMAVGHFEPDNTSSGFREDVAQVDFLLEPTPTGNITGIISSLDSSGDTPVTDILSGAQVFLGDEDGESITTTGSDGLFTFTDVLIGTYKIVVLADGHMTNTFSAVVEDSQTTTQNVTLIKADDGATTLPYLVVEEVTIDQQEIGTAQGVITGYAFQSANLLIPNEPIGDNLYQASCGSADSSDYSGCFDPATFGNGTVFDYKDKDGNPIDSELTIILNGKSLTKALPAGQAQFEVNFPLIPGVNTVTMRAYNSLGANFPELPVYELDFTPPIGSLYGQVTDQTGDPDSGGLKNAVVSISTEGFNTLTTTDDNGNFRLDGVPALQTVSVEVTKWGYGSYSQEVFLERSGRITFNVKLDEVPTDRVIEDTQPARIIIDPLVKSMNDPSKWRISGTVENTNAETLVIKIQNFDDATVDSVSVPLNYGVLTTNTFALFNATYYLHPGSNLIQAQVINSKASSEGFTRASSRVMEIQVPYPSRDTTTTIDEELSMLNLETNLGQVKGVVDKYYQGSTIQLLVNQEIEDRTFHEGTTIDIDGDGACDKTLKAFIDEDAKADNWTTAYTVCYDWTDVQLEEGIMNEIQVKVMIAKDLDGDGIVNYDDEDLDGDGHLDPNTGNQYVGGVLNVETGEYVGGLTHTCENDHAYKGGEDVNCNGILDIGEDLDGDGKLDAINEDINSNEKLDQDEDEFEGLVFSQIFYMDGPEAFDFPMLEELSNGFETGGLKNWDTSNSDEWQAYEWNGIKPKGGDYMVGISTGWTCCANQEAYISKTITLPSNVSTIDFDYVHATLDYVPFSDGFKVTLTHSGGTETLVFSDIEGSNWTMNKNWYGWKYKTDNADDGHWISQSADISQFAGQEVTIKFAVYDKLDGIVDTVVLLDNFKLTTSSTRKLAAAE